MLPEIIELAELLVYQAIEQALAGTCPKCYHPIETEVLLEEKAPQPSFRAECDTCGGTVVGPVGFCLLVDPEVAAFYQRHERGLREHYIWELPLIRESAITNVEEDPVQVEIGISFDEKSLGVVVDETGHLTTIDR